MSSLFSLKSKKFKKNAFCIQVVFVLFAILIVGQLLKVQVIQGKTLADKAERQRSGKIGVTYRGEIFDRNGVRLAASTTLYDIYAHPRYYKLSSYQIAKLLEPYLNMSFYDLTQTLKKPYSTITLVKDLDRDVIKKIKKLKIKGLDIVKKTERIYPQKTLAAHILGYVNPEANIYAGVEKTGSNKLQHVTNIQKIQYTGRGDVIYDFNTEPEAALNLPSGERVYLTLDAEVQNIAEIELAKMLKKTNASRGTVIVMNPKNGEILGFAVLPTYNPNDYNNEKPSTIKNWALSDVYPPGSTFKMLTIASALEGEFITKDIKIRDTGRYKLQGRTITNHDFRRHGAPGMIDLEYLFEHSSNVGALQIALKMPPHKFYNMLKKFGIGNKTGIDLPGESAGIVPKLKRWQKIDQASIGFGYTIATTPIQMAAATAAIANDGVWTTPHVIKYSEEQAKNKIITRRVISKKNANDLTEILTNSIKYGRSKSGKIKNYNVAGKSGTSRKPSPKGGYYEDQVFTSFIGYFPAKNPEVLIMVVIDNPEGPNSWGSTVAGPVFNSVAERVSRVLNLKQDSY